MAVYLDLDDSVDPAALGLARQDARDWGPRLRCFAPRAAMQQFMDQVAATLPPFVLFGSGDFHHLTAAFLRKVRAPFNLVAFDNHPDWDVRPPYWACGGWMKRALPYVERAAVWGCGNFELNWPSRLFGSGGVVVYGWHERYPKRGTMTRSNWQSQFEAFSDSLRGQNVYVTVDMDCLREEEAVTNWENGLFTVADIAWAIGVLRSRANVIAGDVCGAYSPPVYERRKQRFAAEWDHPKIETLDFAAARATNTKSLRVIWPALVNSPSPTPLPG